MPDSLAAGVSPNGTHRAPAMGELTWVRATQGRLAVDVLMRTRVDFTRGLGV